MYRAPRGRRRPSLRRRCPGRRLLFRRPPRGVERGNAWGVAQQEGFSHSGKLFSFFFFFGLARILADAFALSFFGTAGTSAKRVSPRVLWDCSYMGHCFLSCLRNFWGTGE